MLHALSIIVPDLAEVNPVKLIKSNYFGNRPKVVLVLAHGAITCFIERTGWLIRCDQIAFCRSTVMVSSLSIIGMSSAIRSRRSWEWCQRSQSASDRQLARVIR